MKPIPQRCTKAQWVRSLVFHSSALSVDCFSPLTHYSPMAATRWIAIPLTGLLLILAGCGGGSGPAAPPSGWEASETRMWKEGVDTSEVFRDLNSLSSMGILEEDFALSSGQITQEQFTNAIKQSLENLYRTNPTLVDSLFKEHAASELEGADLSGNVIADGQLEPKLLNEYKKAAFKEIEDHYRQPQLKEGVSGITYPDTLRTEENSGRVEIQMHIDSTGAVDAVEVIEGTHPTLDAIAMKAATETTWEPGYVRRGAGEEWKPKPGWGRSPIDFPAPR